MIAGMANLKPPPFNAFTIKFDRKVQLIITPIKIAEAFDPKEVAPETVNHLEFTALWDTGATGSVIKNSTAQRLGLIPSGITRMNHAGGCSDSNTYVVNILLPNNVGIVGVQVSECAETVGDFGAIIGMDIINKGDLSISNIDEKTCMTYRFPSYRTYDFVEEYNKLLFSGVQPYHPCPCGKVDKNGKPVNFSQCHGKKTNHH